MLRATTLILVLSLPTTAHSECYVRSAMTSLASMSITNIADMNSMVVPISPTQNKCFVNFRAQVNGGWITVEAEKVGLKNIPEKQLCDEAIEQGRIQVLSRANPGRIQVEQNMVCDERSAIQVRKVKPGEMILESEVRPHPNFPKPFTYRTSKCRWFIEPEVHPGKDLLQRQGIVCQINSNQWQVVDKW